MHPHVHSSTIHSSQDIETTCKSIDRGIDKEDVVLIHNGILLSHEKEETHGIAASWMHLEMIILSEQSQTEEDKHMISQLWVISASWLLRIELQ